MDISYLGESKFKIKGKNGSVVADTTALTVSHKTGGEDFVITEPGEYEVEGISVFGSKINESKIYVVQCDDVRVVYLGSLNKTLSEKEITDLENIDVVIVGVDTLPMKDTIEIVSKLEPYYILPYGEMTGKFISSYEHSSRAVKSLNLSKLGMSEDLTEVITFE